MKKFTCLLLAALMVLGLAGSALAASISASYDKDTQMLTVSTDAEGFYEVYVDGNDTHKWVGSGMSSQTFKFPLEDGSHTVTLFSNSADPVSPRSFYVGEKPVVTEEPEITEAPTQEPVVTEAPTQEPVVTEAPTQEPVVTEAPTQEPVVTEAPTQEPYDGPLEITSGSYNNHKLSLTVRGLKSSGEIWVDGKNTNRYISAPAGSISFDYTVNEGSHTVMVFVPSTNESDTFTFTFTIAQPKVSADYFNGTLTYTASQISNSCELWLDGTTTNRSVMADGTYTLKIDLAHGTHTLMVWNPVGNKGGETTFFAHVAEEIPAVEPTCTEVGNTAGYKCSVCGEILVPTEEIPALGHDIVADEAVEPTCTETGLTAGEHCTRCDYKVEQEVVDALGHDLVKDEAVAPTCTETGLTEGEHCTRCDYKVAQEVVDALGHDLVADEGKEPTCVEDGLTAGEHCTRCDYVKAGEVIPATGEHTWGEEEFITPASCVKPGLSQYTCQVCGFVEQNEIPPIGKHNYHIVERTADKIIYKCTVCGDTYSVVNNSPVKNLYGMILMDANLVSVDYTATTSAADDKTLVIVADLSKKEELNLTSEVGMYLTPELIASIKGEGFTRINYINADASIVIELNDITADWFTTDKEIIDFVFSTDPADPEGILVKVEVLVDGSEKVPANEFTGVTLKSVDGDVDVTVNGVY